MQGQHLRWCGGFDWMTQCPVWWFGQCAVMCDRFNCHCISQPVRSTGLCCHRDICSSRFSHTGICFIDSRHDSPVLGLFGKCNPLVYLLNWHLAIFKAKGCKGQGVKMSCFFLREQTIAIFSKNEMTFDLFSPCFSDWINLNWGGLSMPDF